MHPQKNCVRIFLGDYNICDTTDESVFEILLSKIKVETPPPAHEITEESTVPSHEMKNYCRDELVHLKKIMGYYAPI